MKLTHVRLSLSRSLKVAEYQYWKQEMALEVSVEDTDKSLIELRDKLYESIDRHIDILQKKELRNYEQSVTDVENSFS